MSSEFLCEVCRKEGRRRMMTFVPEGWFYAEAFTEDDEGNPTGVLVIGVCSEQCKTAFFKPGPGRMTGDGMQKEPK